MWAFTVLPDAFAATSDDDLTLHVALHNLAKQMVTHAVSNFVHSRGCMKMPGVGCGRGVLQCASPASTKL
jgi:hypothetical protein